MRTETGNRFWAAVERRLDGRPWSWLARKCGVSPATLQSWRRGLPRYGQVVTISGGLGCRPSRLYEEME